MGFLSVPNLVPCLIFIVNILCVVTDQFCWTRLQFGVILQISTVMGIYRGLRTVVGGGDFSG